MDYWINLILTWVLSTEFMTVAWGGCIITSIVVARKTGAYGLSILAGGATPKFIFYTYKLLKIWDVSPAAILYSRIADVSLVISIFLGLWLMYRSVYNDGFN